MAIKLPDPGNGIPEQKTGNDEWTNMQIVRDNFADQSNAASRLVGVGPGQIPLAQDSYRAAFGTAKDFPAGFDLDNAEAGTVGIAKDNILNKPTSGWYVVYTQSHHERLATMRRQIAHLYSYGNSIADEWSRLCITDGSGGVNAWSAWGKTYTTVNTTVDSNKNIKQSSPVVRVFNDRLDKIHEANQLPIKYTRNGVGDYTIEGTTGLRENDWQIVIPEDDHRNQLIAFTIEDNDGAIHLKTYKRTFSMETFTFGPDLSTPLDIPEGRWVDLHFNDLPEQTDEPAI